MRKLFLAASIFLQAIASAEAEETDIALQPLEVADNQWEQTRDNPPKSPTFTMFRPEVPVVTTTATPDAPAQDVLTTWDIMQLNFGL